MSLEKFKPLEQKLSASERVARRLTGLIASGNIMPGEKLPSEHELSKSMRVSRPVVREALRGLAMMGIVESRQGGGCYVTDLKPNRLMAPLSFALSLQDYSLEGLFRAREIIDTGLAHDAALHATSEQIATLAHLVETGYKLIDDPIAFRVMDAEFHELVSGAARNDFLDAVSRSLYTLAIDQRRKASARPGVLARSAADHDAIAKAISARDAAAAGAAMASHVRNIRNSTIAIMSEGEVHPLRSSPGLTGGSLSARTAFPVGAVPAASDPPVKPEDDGSG